MDACAQTVATASATLRGSLMQRPNSHISPVRISGWLTLSLLERHAGAAYWLCGLLGETEAWSPGWAIRQGEGSASSGPPKKAAPARLDT